MEHTIEIPADARTVTLELKKQTTFTLRSLLPYVKDMVELVVQDKFGHGVSSDSAIYRLDASNGPSMLDKLERSHLVDGEALLDLTPTVSFMNSTPTMVNGTLANLSCTGCILLTVTPTIQES